MSTLSAAQLERKRANDREAQRAIRQRTKDHIDTLERTVSELRHSNEANENIVVMTQRRNRELEEENGYLKSRLGETGYHLNVHPPERETAFFTRQMLLGLTVHSQIHDHLIRS